MIEVPEELTVVAILVAALATQALELSREYLSWQVEHIEAEEQLRQLLEHDAQTPPYTK